MQRNRIAKTVIISLFGVSNCTKSSVCAGILNMVKFKIVPSMACMNKRDGKTKETLV